MPDRVRVDYWAEGPTDRAVARRLIQHAGGEPGADYGVRSGAVPGKDYLDSNLHRYNAAAKHGRWLVLRDSDGECPLHAVRRILSQPAEYMRFRIVVPEVEAWLLADHEAFADMIKIEPLNIPDRPESLSDAKASVLSLVRRSRSRLVREDLLPDPRSGRKVGPLYAGRLMDFASNSWDPSRALDRAPSLRRALAALEDLIASRRC